MRSFLYYAETPQKGSKLMNENKTKETRFTAIQQEPELLNINDYYNKEEAFYDLFSLFDRDRCIFGEIVEEAVNTFNNFCNAIQDASHQETKEIINYCFKDYPLLKNKNELTKMAAACDYELIFKDFETIKYLLELLYNKPFKTGLFYGSCQGEVYRYYIAEENAKNLVYIEDILMGYITEFCIIDNETEEERFDIVLSFKDTRTELLKIIGCEENELTIKIIDGYTYTPKYKEI